MTLCVYVGIVVNCIAVYFSQASALLDNRANDRADTSLACTAYRTKIWYRPDFMYRPIYPWPTSVYNAVVASLSLFLNFLSCFLFPHYLSRLFLLHHTSLGNFLTTCIVIPAVWMGLFGSSVNCSVLFCCILWNYQFLRAQISYIHAGHLY